jgi:hypothetical protein
MVRDSNGKSSAANLSEHRLRSLRDPKVLERKPRNLLQAPDGSRLAAGLESSCPPTLDRQDNGRHDQRGEGNTEKFSGADVEHLSMLPVR